MKQLILVLLLFTLAPQVLAQTGEITLGTEQAEYSFLIGEEGRIPFDIESTYQNTIVGTLEYDLTSSEEDAGFSFTQTNSQSQTFPVQPGPSKNAITLTSPDPAEYEISLSLHYRDQGKEFAAELPPVKVHFVRDHSEFTRNSESLTSTTAEVSGQGSQSSASQAARQMEDQMNAIRSEQQQMMQQFFSPGTSSSSGQNQPQNIQQALQNGQMNAPAGSLQQQLAQESEEKRAEHQRAAEALSSDPLVEEMARQLQDDGFNQTGGSMQPSGTNSGAFSASFTAEDGRTAEMTGTYRNGTVSSLTTTSNQSLPRPAGLLNDAQYQEERSDLERLSFNQTAETISMSPNETVVRQEFKDPDGNNATITATIVNGTLTDLTVERDRPVWSYWIIGVLLLVLLILICLALLYRYLRIRATPDQAEGPVPVEEPAPDYSSEVTDLLARAEKALGDGDLKTAYVLTGQALRLYVAITAGTGSAGTNDETIALLKRQASRSRSTRDFQDLLARCELVEFARYEGSSDEGRDFIRKVRAFTGETTPGENPESGER